MAYEVCTPVFAGPFDLLLHLILREQVDLYEVNLSEIVDDYLVELDRMKSCDLEVTTNFLLVAATLLELKARRLLPCDTEVDLDEELGLWEERDLLLARLVECKTFKDVAAVFRVGIEATALSRPRTVGVTEERLVRLTPPTAIDPGELQAAYLRAIAPRSTPRVDLSHMTPITATVADAVSVLVFELPRQGEVTFRQLTAELDDRIEIIVRFLAVLELIKQGLVDIRQPDIFGEITVRWIGPDELVMAAAPVDTYDG